MWEQAPENLNDVLRRVRRLEIKTRRAVNDVFAGAYRSVFRGQGMEFDEVREYRPGDDIRTIDWNVTARTGRPHVKRFLEERELQLVFLLDVSASGWFGSTGRTKLETAAEICAVLAFSAIGNNDKVGAVVFSDRVERFIPPAKGRRHGLRVVRELLFPQPAGTGTDVGAALAYTSRVLKRRAVVVVLSDFLSPPFDRPLAAAAARFDVVAVRIVDPRERTLPPVGLLRVWDQEARREVIIDTARPGAAAAVAASAQARETALAGLCRRHGVDLVTVGTDEDPVVPLARFFHARERRR